MLTASDLRQIRLYVTWNPPTDTDLQDRYTALQADTFPGAAAVWQHVAYEYVLERRNTIAANPSQFGVPGEYSEGWSPKEQLAALNGILGQLASYASPEVGGGIAVGTMYRGDL